MFIALKRNLQKWARYSDLTLMLLCALAGFHFLSLSQWLNKTQMLNTGRNSLAFVPLQSPNTLFCKRKPVDENANSQPDHQSNLCSSSSPTSRPLNFPLCMQRHLENHCLASCKHSTGSVPPKPLGHKLTVKTLRTLQRASYFSNDKPFLLLCFPPEGNKHFVFKVRVPKPKDDRGGLWVSPLIPRWVETSRRTC